MGRKRNDLEITADILRIAIHGAKKTHVVYKANLNFKVLHEYLDAMEDAGLVTYEEGEIKTTEKGLEFLKNYDDFMKYLESSTPLT